MKEDLITIETKEAPEIGGKIAECNALAEQVQGSLTRAWQTAAVLGYQLCEIKAQLPHGQFTKLFSSKGSEKGNHGFLFTKQMANRYMDLYRKCAAAAGKIGQEEALRTMMGDSEGRGFVGGKLSNLLTSLAPQATSMRQALFAFMEEEDEEEEEEAAAGDKKGKAKFALPNRKGQVKEREVEQESVKQRNWEMLDRAICLLEEAASSGAHLHLPDGTRLGLMHRLQDVLDKVSHVN